MEGLWNAKAYRCTKDTGTLGNGSGGYIRMASTFAGQGKGYGDIISSGWIGKQKFILGYVLESANYTLSFQSFLAVI